MATIKYQIRLKQWQIRWHITDPISKQITKGSKLLPKGCTRPEAENYANSIREKTRLIKSGSRPTTDSLPAAVEKWLGIIKEHTDRTVNLYTRVINLWTASLPKHISNISQILPQNISDYTSKMMSEKLTSRTVNSHLTVIKSFCKWISQTYRIENPSEFIKMLKEQPPDQRFLTEAEFQKILDCNSGLFRQRALFIANTGLRTSEFCNFKWSDIDARQQSITIIGKGRKRRLVPLNNTCRQILNRLHKESEYVFFSKNNKNKIHKLNRSVLYDQCAEFAKKNSMPIFGAHSLRHWFATQMLIKGIPIALVSQVLGHSSINTTMKIYIHICPAHLAGLTNCLD